MFLGLRMIEGISKEEFHQAFDRKYDSVYGEVTEKLVQQGLIEVNGDNVTFNEKRCGFKQLCNVPVFVVRLL